MMDEITKTDVIYLSLVALLMVLLAVVQVSGQTISLDANETLNFTYAINSSGWQDFFCENINLTETSTFNLLPGEQDVTVYEKNGIKVIGSCNNDDVEGDVCIIDRKIKPGQLYIRDSNACNVEVFCEEFNETNKFNDVTVVTKRLQIYENGDYIQIDLDDIRQASIFKNNTVRLDQDISIICPVEIDTRDIRTDELTKLCEETFPSFFQVFQTTLDQQNSGENRIDELNTELQQTLSDCRAQEKSLEFELNERKNELESLEKDYEICQEEVSNKGLYQGAVALLIIIIFVLIVLLIIIASSKRKNPVRYIE